MPNTLLGDANPSVTKYLMDVVETKLSLSKWCQDRKTALEWLQEAESILADREATGVLDGYQDWYDDLMAIIEEQRRSLSVSRD